jgi:GNAT superfamily N-acetyltransferase
MGRKSMLVIRLAKPIDVAALARLRYALRSKTDDVETESEFIQRCRAWMAEHLESKFWRAWVLEEAGEIVGALWLQLIEKIPNPTAETELYAYITNVFVLENLRGEGLGSKLLDEALTFCTQAGVNAAILWPSEKSRTLYERHGFAVRDDLMELYID